MRTNGAIVISLLALILPARLASQAASVRTISGSVIQGEVQGLIVARAEGANGEIELAVFKGQDIRSIQDSGIVVAAVARYTYHRVPGSDLPLPPDAVMAWLIANDTSQTWSQPVGAIRLAVIGELQPPKDVRIAGEARIVSRVRIRTAQGEVSIAVRQLPDPTRGTKPDPRSPSK